MMNYDKLLTVLQRVNDSDLDDVIEKHVPYPLKVRYRELLIELYIELKAVGIIPRFCEVCGTGTKWCCSDCRIESQKKTYICDKRKCRKQHEALHPNLIHV